MRITWITHELRELSDVAAVLAKADRPVLLLEGIRALPDSDRPTVVAAGRMLAWRLPAVVFRSGNAEGSDTAFAEGVTSVDPSRMEYVLTHAGMGRKRRHEAGRATALNELRRVADGKVGDYTVGASPDTKGLVEAYRVSGGKGPVGAKAAYLLRDTLKVLGAPEADLAPATAGLFYVNEADPLTGGTGHTVRVCREFGIPVVFQAVWRKWVDRGTGKK